MFPLLFPFIHRGRQTLLSPVSKVEHGALAQAADGPHAVADGVPGGSGQVGQEVPQHRGNFGDPLAGLPRAPESCASQATRTGRAAAEEGQGEHQYAAEDHGTGPGEVAGPQPREATGHDQVRSIGIRVVAGGGHREPEPGSALCLRHGSVLYSVAGGQRVQSLVLRRETGKVSGLPTLII